MHGNGFEDGISDMYLMSLVCIVYIQLYLHHTLYGIHNIPTRAVWQLVNNFR